MILLLDFKNNPVEMKWCGCIVGRISLRWRLFTILVWWKTICYDLACCLPWWQVCLLWRLFLLRIISRSLIMSGFQTELRQSSVLMTYLVIPEVSNLSKIIFLSFNRRCPKNIMVIWLSPARLKPNKNIFQTRWINWLAIYVRIKMPY